MKIIKNKKTIIFFCKKNERIKITSLKLIFFTVRFVGNIFVENMFVENIFGKVATLNPNSMFV